MSPVCVSANLCSDDNATVQEDHKHFDKYLSFLTIWSNYDIYYATECEKYLHLYTM